MINSFSSMLTSHHVGLIVPVVGRGISLDPQIQVGWYGTPLQLLNQQGRIAEGLSWGLAPSNSLLCRTEKVRVIYPNQYKQDLSILPVRHYLDG